MERILQEGLRRLGLDSGEAVIAQFLTYYELLVSYNKKVNLTAITAPEEVAVKHFLDSVALLALFDLPRGARVVDVGTGAGFPGLPLKIVRPDIDLTLVDALGKRVTFLRMCADTLGLTQVTCLHARAEELGKKAEHREQYDVAVSRAVANLATLSEYCLPLVRLGGTFAALKGPAAPQELSGAKNAIAVLGGGNACIKLAEIADAELKHAVVLVDKIGHTPPKYPR
ncbi:MAG TPA: 16S rRNA (guanine(527)-N(7))-methyltransferase RsmG, partial [Candidatus Aphodoplasma excrementigallinarum]|nr:16S rRNA (guanine(527)-N(7))-methyltransferase RsmG [Candidatus Aphodoplasma excrementigallinarum]